MDGSLGKKRRRASVNDEDSDTETTCSTADGDRREGDEGRRGWQKTYTKQNHSEIEKRRRDKMNTYINELSSMIPMCNAMSRKLDKLTVLRMAVQHMKTIKGALDPFTETNYKPSFLSDEDLKNLILETAEGFLFVVGCDRGCLLYASDSIRNYLNQSPSDLIGHSFLDLIHQKDISKVKEQLSSSDTTPREKLLDPKTGLPLKTEYQPTPTRLCTGSRRSFFCRMRCGHKGTKTKDSNQESEPCIIKTKTKTKTKQAAPPENKRYIVVHCTGYLKSWPPSGTTLDDEEEDNESRNLSCLVAVGRQEIIYDEMTDYSQPGTAREFISRHTIDGKFIFVDQRTTAITGYLPQDLIGSSGYEFFHQDDLNAIAVSHRKSLQGETVVTVPYRFRCKGGFFVPLITKSSVFRNPWSKELEFIFCVNIVVTDLAFLSSLAPGMHTSSSSLQTTDSMPLASSDSLVTTRPYQSGIQQVLEVLRKRALAEPDLKSAAQSTLSNSSDIDGEMSGAGAVRIGCMVAEEVQNQEANDKKPVVKASRSNEDLSVNYTLGASTINMDDISLNASSVSRPSSVGALDSRSSAFDHRRQESQAHLLEQLIGMQNAIESMEAPMEQSEETMSVFMNMLEADAGLGSEF